MKKLVCLSIAAASLVVIASPAAAQDVTGTVNITGSVDGKCRVVPTDDDSFTATVALGELAQSDGTLATDLATRFSSVGTGLEVQVICTSAAPTIAIDATEITSATSAPSGYANRIDYTANVAVDTVTTSDVPFSNSSTGAALAATAIGGYLANSPNNVTISASNFATPNATDLLVAATDYTGQIVIVIAPGP